MHGLAVGEVQTSATLATFVPSCQYCIVLPSRRSTLGILWIRTSGVVNAWRLYFFLACRVRQTHFSSEGRSSWQITRHDGTNACS